MTSAGEVEQFVYCPQNWWLARHGTDNHNQASQDGIAAHQRMGRRQSRIEREKRETRRAWSWFPRVVAFACAATVLTLEVAYLRSFEHIVILVTATCVLVVGSAATLLLGLIHQERYKRHQTEAGLIPGRLAATDLGGDGPLLHDAAWDLSGRPDYVLETKQGLVPVEVKTGQTPARPHRNHQLQLACYLRLLEVQSGKPPEYGLLNYPEGVFRVAWDDALRNDLQATLQRIARARAEGKADRDHEHRGRCLGCARRDACAQKLS